MSESAQKDRVDLDAAKELSLQAFLETELGVAAKRVGSGLRMDSCPACGEGKVASHKLSISKDDRTYRCFSCGSQGSILDAGMALWGVDLVEVGRRLLGDRPLGDHTEVKLAKPKIDPQVAEAERKEQTALMRKALGLIQQATLDFKDESVPLNYLVHDRGIPLRIVREGQRRGMVGFLPGDSQRAFDVVREAVGEDLLRKSGLWKPDKKMPGIVYRRPLIFFLPGLSSAEFRVAMKVVPEGWTKSIRYGNLEYPYWWQGDDGSKDCMIVEGAIDLMSAVALDFKGHIMGLTGCNTFIRDWFPKAAARHHLARYVICLDNDVNSKKNPGQMWANNLHAELTEMGLPSFIKAPVQGDLNDLWLAKVSKMAA